MTPMSSNGINPVPSRFSNISVSVLFLFLSSHQGVEGGGACIACANMRRSIQMQASPSTARVPNIRSIPTDHTRSARKASTAGKQQRQSREARPVSKGFDLVLSSGFLAFANHCGFLAAVEDVGLPVNAVMGTSAGALSGSLYCAGYAPTEVAAILSRTAPIKRLRPCYSPWAGGMLTLDAVVEELRGLLPPRFDDLPRPLGVGVAGAATGQHVLVDSGVLPEAVAASAAIPLIFSPMQIPGVAGGPFMDGGVHCRIGLELWRQGRYSGSHAGTSPPAVVHLISRSSPFSGNDSTQGLKNAMVLHAPKSGKSFFDLGDFETEFEAARRRALPMLRELLERQQEQQLWQQQQQQEQGGWEDEQTFWQPQPTVAP